MTEKDIKQGIIENIDHGIKGAHELDVLFGDFINYLSKSVVCDDRVVMSKDIFDMIINNMQKIRKVNKMNWDWAEDVLGMFKETLKVER